MRYSTFAGPASFSDAVFFRFSFVLTRIELHTPLGDCRTFVRMYLLAYGQGLGHVVIRVSFYTLVGTALVTYSARTASDTVPVSLRREEEPAGRIRWQNENNLWCHVMKTCDAIQQDAHMSKMVHQLLNGG